MKKISLFCTLLISLSLCFSSAHGMKRKWDDKIENVVINNNYTKIEHKENNKNIFVVTQKMKEKEVLNALQGDDGIKILTFKSFNWNFNTTESLLIQVMENYKNILIDCKTTELSKECIQKFGKNIIGVLLAEKLKITSDLFNQLPNLQSLEICSPLNDETLKELNNFLISNKTVTELNIKYTTIDKNAAKAIRNILKYNTTIESLNLQHTALKDNEAMIIADGAKDNKTLKLLDFRSTFISINTANEISEMLKGVTVYF